MEKIVWLILGVVTLGAAVRSYRSRRALEVGRVALGVLFVLAGAVVNAVYLFTGADYGSFADAAHLRFVRDAWHSLVAPHQGLFIGALVVFEATVGILVLRRGRSAQAGLIGIIGMHLGLLLFGWVLTIWAVLMLVALVHLLRAERRWNGPWRQRAVVS